MYLAKQFLFRKVTVKTTHQSLFGLLSITHSSNNKILTKLVKDEFFHSVLKNIN